MEQEPLELSRRYATIKLLSFDVHTRFIDVNCTNLEHADETLSR